MRQDMIVSKCQNAVMTRLLVWAMWSNERSKKSFRAAQLSAGRDCSTLQQISLLLCRPSSTPYNWALLCGILVGPEIWTTDGIYSAQRVVFTQVVGKTMCFDGCGCCSLVHPIADLQASHTFQIVTYLLVVCLAWKLLPILP